MCIYGIVKIEVYSYNKRVIYILSCIHCLIIPANTRRKGNPKMSVVYCGAPTPIYLRHLTPGQALRFTYTQHCHIQHGGSSGISKIRQRKISIEIKILSGIPEIKRRNNLY